MLLLDGKGASSWKCVEKLAVVDCRNEGRW